MDKQAVVDNCDNFNSNIVNIIHVIIVIIILTLLFIFILNILNYVLYNIYCMRDIGDKYIKEEGTTKLQDMYKHRLLNYVKNFDITKYSYNIKYDNNSSDLYIHNINAYFNYIVKLLLLISIFILIGVVYNLYYIFINSVHSSKCDDGTAYKCTYLLTYIYEKQPHIYYLFIIIFICIYGHSFIYTYLFNNMVYQDLYDLYNKQYVEVDKYIKKKIHNLNRLCNTTTTTIGTPPTTTTTQDHPDKVSLLYENTSIYTDQLMEFSLYKLDLRNFIIYKTTNEATIVNNYNKLIEDGLSYNLKFIIPDEQYNDINEINDLLKNICNIKGFSKTDHALPQFALVDKENSVTKIIEEEIFIYLVYHFVISHNMDDPFIIHKLNNIFFNIFENIKKKYKEDKKLSDIASKENAANSSAEAIKKETAEEIKKRALEKEEQDSAMRKASPDEKKRLEERANYIAKIDGIKSADKADPEGEDDGYKIIEMLNYDIKKLYREIICSYSLKLLLPENITQDYINEELTKNAKLIVKYIKFYIGEKNKIEPVPSAIELPLINTKIIDAFGTIEKHLNDSITEFAVNNNNFVNFKQENDDKLTMSKIVYKFNIYLIVDMFYTALFILSLLIIMYNLISTKYPSIKPLIINMITSIYIIIAQMS